MTTYRMSKDYDALHDLLCDGGEALGKTGHRPARMYRHIDRLFITNTSEPIEVFDIGIGEAAFKSACTRLNLEWLAPVDLAGVLEAGDAIIELWKEELRYDGYDTSTVFREATYTWTTATAKLRKP